MKSNLSRKPKIDKYMHITKPRKNIQELLKEDSTLSTVIVKLFDYMMTKGDGLFGCCHALSSVLYVALSELGYSPQIYIGECKYKEREPFDHSWITIDDKVIDLAIFMPLTLVCGGYTGPIILDIDAISMRKSEMEYGINTGLPLAKETTFALNTPFVDYMDMFPYENEGLWTVLKMIMPDNSMLDISQLKEKYKNTERVFIR